MYSHLRYNGHSYREFLLTENKPQEPFSKHKILSRTTQQVESLKSVSFCPEILRNGFRGNVDEKHFLEKKELLLLNCCKTFSWEIIQLTLNTQKKFQNWFEIPLLRAKF